MFLPVPITIIMYYSDFEILNYCILVLLEKCSIIGQKLRPCILDAVSKLTRKRLCVFWMEMDQTPGFMTRGTGKLPGTTFTVMSVGWVVGTKYTSNSCKVKHPCHSAVTIRFMYTFFHSLSSNPPVISELPLLLFSVYVKISIKTFSLLKQIEHNPQWSCCLSLKIITTY